MIDASLSAHKEITFEQEAAHFIAGVRPATAFLFSFDENVTQVARFPITSPI